MSWRVEILLYPDPMPQLGFVGIVSSSWELSYFSLKFSSLLESSSKTDFLDNNFCTIADGWLGLMSRLNLPLLSAELEPGAVSRVSPDHFSYRSSRSFSRSSRSIVVGSGGGSGIFFSTSGSFGGDVGGVRGLRGNLGLTGLGAGIATARRPCWWGP